MGAPADDSALLDRYAASRDEAAFHELVRRYVNLVYSAAARRVRDRHMAEDVTQAVFVILSRKVEAARRSGSLAAWLLRAVRYAAANAVKIERRRRRREAAAARRAEAAGACSPNPSDALAWQEVAAHLDDAVLALPAVDRCAIVLRFFEHKSIRDVADALNLTEAAAKQRLSRSVERLRQRLARRGIVAPAGAAGLSTLLATHAAAAAPAGVLTSACSVTTTVATGAASLTIAKGAITMMAWTKVKAAAAVLAVASVLGTGTVITLQRAQAQDGAPAAAGGGAGLAEKAAARVKAAEQVVEILTLREEANEPLTPAHVELKLSAQRRLAEARIDASIDKVERVRAAEQYVENCRAALALLERRKGQDVTAVQISQGEYQVADAEYLLAKVQASG